MRIVTFGEIMLRLAPNGYYRFFQTDQLQATFGGAEANVAVSLAGFGEDVSFVTRLPEHMIGQSAVNSLRYFGVDTSLIVRGGERVGIYYLEKGASQRGSLCIYDRKGSSFSESVQEDYDWEEIFRNADWFHFTGITPALGGSLPEICLHACKTAKEKGIKISCDLNYRSKLWSRPQANEIMSRLCPYVDVCICNEEDAADVFGIKADNTDVNSGIIEKEAYISAAQQLQERFGFDSAAFTLRSSLSANDNDWSAMLYTGGKSFFSRQYHVHIVDRVGAGDSFAAGLIYSMLHDNSPEYSIEFAAAASALKHSVEGDFNRASVAEVERLAGGNGSGRVRR